MTTREPWNRREVELIVDDYLDMLHGEIGGNIYNKTSHRNELRPKLNGRTDGSIEFKHCNISAVLRDAGRPYIAGYNPRGNTQDLVRRIVDEKWNQFTSTLGQLTLQTKSSEESGRGSVKSDHDSGWLSDVASCVEELDQEFTLDEVYEYEQVLSSFHPDNHNVKPKIRQILQQMREAGVIEFTDDDGRYRKTGEFPGGIQIVDLSSDDSSDPFASTSDIPDDPVERYFHAIRKRRGARRFRRSLLRLYGGKCAITGDGPSEVLEAAHIEPHSTNGRNSLDNGLLLRADIHTLFDLGLIWVDPSSMSVKIDQKLRSTSYEVLEGRILRSRTDGSAPSREFLAARTRLD